jgi:hypothetical protein
VYPNYREETYHLPAQHLVYIMILIYIYYCFFAQLSLFKCLARASKNPGRPCLGSWVTSASEFRKVIQIAPIHLPRRSTKMHARIQIKSQCEQNCCDVPCVVAFCLSLLLYRKTKIMMPTTQTRAPIGSATARTTGAFFPISHKRENWFRHCVVPYYIFRNK